MATTKARVRWCVRGDGRSNEFVIRGDRKLTVSLYALVNRRTDYKEVTRPSRCLARVNEKRFIIRVSLVRVNGSCYIYFKQFSP